MKVIAITGGIASGKSTVANIFNKKYSIPVIDTDFIARDIVKPHSVLLNQIIAKFGSFILNPDKTLNRKLLREIIFNNPESKKWLEQLLHPKINKQIQHIIKQLENNNYPYCLVLIPLLTKEYLASNKYIDHVITVQSSADNQIKRASVRDQQTGEQIKNIINSQLSNKERAKLADYIIDNNTNIENLELEVDKLHKTFTSK